MSARDKNLVEEETPRKSNMYKNTIIFNMKQLDKMIDAFSKELFSSQLEKQSGYTQVLLNHQEREKNRLSMNPNANSSVEQLLVDLQ